MATETDTSLSGWTTETLRQFFATIHNDLKDSITLRFTEREQLNSARFATNADRIEALQKIIETRLDSMDKASQILSENVTRVPTLLDRELERITVLMIEKFTGVQRQFEERDTRSRAAQQSAETAVNAALASQKEAVASQNTAAAAAITKSEVATVKQMDSMLALMTSSTNALDGKIDALKQRLDREEGKNQGFSSYLSTGLIIVAVVISLIGVAVNFLNSKSATPASQERIILEPGVVAVPGK